MFKEKTSIKEIFNLAFKHYQNGNLKKAEILFKKILKTNPNQFESIFYLGTLLAQNKNFYKAINYYKKAIQINPNSAEAHNNLGNAFKDLGKYQESISSYQNAIKINPDFVGVYFNLGSVLQKLGKYHEAIPLYQKVIKMKPNYIPAYNNLGMAFDKLNRHQEAIKCFQMAIKMEPNNLTSHWLSMNTFPITYENLKEIHFYRKRFENGINKVNQLLDKQLQYTKKQIIDAINSSTNFYLHYQGSNDLKLQIKYGQLVERLTQKIYPQFHQKKKLNKSTKFIKIGFISSFFKRHSITKTYKNWILKLDKNLFKTFVYYVGNEFDKTTSQIKESSNNFYNNTNIDELINQISEDKLDILVYLDIGMHPTIQILASLRLAPIQCNTWGHPVTSGLKNIDYFFSGELIEQRDSQKYYSEKLINLPGLGTNYNYPDLSNIKKTIHIKKTNKIIFLNFQSLFKLLPQDDHIFLDIQQKVPNCEFWFFKAKSELITYIFKSRLSKLSKDYGISFDKYFHFHPRCKYNEFLGVIETSDIILDSLNFSGFNTAMEAISLNKPIVTLPELFMRTRFAYSILKKINIEETVASSKEKYVEIAVKLAKDNDFKNSIINKIAKNKNKLFNDEKSIRFFEEVIRKEMIN